jgi:hypothetical protein
MNDIIARTISMTSLEIADLTGKEHKHVLRDIDNLVARLAEDPGPDLGFGFKSTTYESGDPPRSYRMFVMDRDSTYCLITGYDPISRMRVIKKCDALERELEQVASLPARQAATFVHSLLSVNTTLPVGSLLDPDSEPLARELGEALKTASLAIFDVLRRSKALRRGGLKFVPPEEVEDRLDGGVRLWWELCLVEGKITIYENGMQVRLSDGWHNGRIKVLNKLLHLSYKQWCHDNRYDCCVNTVFGRHFKTLSRTGNVRVQSGDEQGWYTNVRPLAECRRMFDPDREEW